MRLQGKLNLTLFFLLWPSYSSLLAKLELFKVQLRVVETAIIPFTPLISLLRFYLHDSINWEDKVNLFVKKTRATFLTRPQSTKCCKGIQ